MIDIEALLNGVQTFIPDLKRFLLPKILCKVSQNNPAHSTPLNGEHVDEPMLEPENWQFVVLRNNRMFAHKLLHIKYTTYDAREGEDVVHIDTDQSNIMVLDSTSRDDQRPETHTGGGSARHQSEGHPFRYGKVLGLYHADVSYIGRLPAGGKDMTPHRVEFLWIRWYRFLGRLNGRSLDRVDFPPMAAPASFGFLDPSDVVRAVHIVPHFALGKLRDDGVAISALANDSNPYKAYYINRYVQAAFGLSGSSVIYGGATMAQVCR
jgi:hypothetical protein